MQRGPGRRIHLVVTVNSVKAVIGDLLTSLNADGALALLGAPADGTLGVRFPRSPIASDMSQGKGFLMSQGQTIWYSLVSSP